MTEAADRINEEIGAEELVEVDQKIQQVIRRDFTALVHVCLTSANLLKNLERAMIGEAEQVAATRLTGIDVAELFLARQSDEEHAGAPIAAAFQVAEPPLVSDHGQFCVVASPPGVPGDRFRDLARRTLGETELPTVVSVDDLVFYRETSHLAVADSRTGRSDRLRSLPPDELSRALDSAQSHRCHRMACSL